MRAASTCVFALALILSATGAAAQPARQEVDCARAPLRGFDFRNCRVSEVREARYARQSWRMSYVDGSSQIVVGYDHALAGGAVPFASLDDTVAAFRAVDAISDDSNDMVDFGLVETANSDRYFVFRRSSLSGERCRAFMRYGPQNARGSSHLISGFFCRRSTEDIAIQEVAFLVDQLVIRSGAISLKAKVCEQSIEYAVTPPAPDVPPEIANFSGFWLGVWDNILCSALIVESVGRDGNTSTKYVWGTANAWGIRAGNRMWAGRVQNGVLTMPGAPTANYRFNGGALAGFYSNGRSQSTGTFKRQ